MIAALDEDDASSIKIVKDLLENPLVSANVLFINCHFKSLPGIISSLEGRNLLLSESISIFDNFMGEISALKGIHGDSLKLKCSNV